MAKSVKKESVGKNKSTVSRGFKLGDITKQQKFSSSKSRQGGSNKLNSLPKPDKSLDFNALSEYIGDRPRVRVFVFCRQ